MFKINNEAELRECFRPIDRDEVILPEGLRFPVLVRDYFTWLEPSGCRVYVVFRDRPSASPLGIAFRRDQSAGAHAVMCEWCRSVRDGGSVGLLSATSSSRKRVGLPLCRDLSCKSKVLAPPGAHDLYETVEPREKVRRIVSRMADFARRELF